MASDRLHSVAIPGQDFKRCQLLIKLQITKEYGCLARQLKRAVAKLGVRKLQTTVVDVAAFLIGCGSARKVAIRHDR